MTLLERLTFWLKVSRPGLWFQTLWIYTVPLGAGMDWQTPEFWLGLLYVTWPLNVLVYGWNDIVDYEIDQLNPRKDSWLFGARGTREQLDTLPPVIALAQVPFAIAFVALAGWKMLALMVAIVAVNATYNAKIGGLRGRPPFDLINPMAYLLVLLLAVWLNNTPMLPWATFIYLALFCGHAQLMGEVMDYHCDKEAGRVTSCTLIGVAPTKWLIIAMVVLEGVILLTLFQDTVLGVMLLGGALWLVWDVLIYSRERRYSRTEFNLAGVGMNALGLVSMMWVWISGSVATLPS
ncbi:MAG: UbiA family prenyltransferase [Myxococcota bacterium]